MIAQAGRHQADPPWEPVPPQTLAAGNAHSLVVSWAGASPDDNEQKRPSLWAWGANRHLQLGSRLVGDAINVESTRSPVLLSFFDPENDGGTSRDTIARRGVERYDEDENHFIVEVACGSNHSMVLECCKEQDPTGDSQTVLRESILWSAGNNTNGQLGRETEDKKNTWGLVTFKHNHGLDVKAVVQRVCCGADHTMAIVNFVNTGVAKETGRVFAWGINANGALGTRRQINEWEPTEVWFEPLDYYDDDGDNSIRHAKCVQLAAGSKHSMALLHNGHVYAWGHGGNGRLGLGKERIGNLQHHGDIAAYDQSYSAQFEPKAISMGPHESNIKFIAAGESHSGAVDQLGRLYTWGQGAHGRCGHGMSIDIMIPTEVDSLLGVAIKQISFGLMHSVASTAKGTLYAWGKGPATGLDAGTVGIVSTPNLVKIDSRNVLVHQISAGPMHTLVLMANGEVYCFGSGSESRMPNTDVSDPMAWQDRRVPHKVPRGKRETAGDSKTIDVVGWNEIEHSKKSKEKQGRRGGRGERDPKWWPKEIFAGGANSACVLEAQDLYMWGSSVLTKECVHTSGGKSGDGADDNRLIPALMKRGLQGKVREIALGAEHVLVINQDFVMFAWGEGRRGQLGTGSLKPASLPTRISHPVDVLSIAAGEEHSACIIEGGEAYTWGNAEGGRLGLGGCLTEGYEMMPKQVEIVDTTYDVLLNRVSCGSQHTSFVSKACDLLTFGTGWFGRLGHGNEDNVYSPQVVKVPEKEFVVRDAKCAAYHTCIIDVEGRLWVTGRDRSVCKGGSGHVKTPALFEPFLVDPPRYIRELATCEQHTLAVTYTKNVMGKESVATELWVWGSNRMGQLGLLPETASYIDMPWQLQLDAKVPDGKPPQIMRVATGPAHSLALVLHKTKQQVENGDRPKKTSKFEPEVFAWGASGSGRLGVPRQAASSMAIQSGSAAQPKRRARSMELIIGPRRVDDQHWRSPGGDDDGPDSMDKDLENEPSELTKVATWADVQHLLQHEKAEKKPQRLKEREEEISKEFSIFMSHIYKLWQQPKDSPTDVTEWNMRLKEKMLETGYIRLLKALGIGSARFAPRLETKTKTDPQIVQRLQHYEDLFFILQQQPLYLANLAKKLLTKRKDDPDIKLFERLVTGIFVDLGDLRIRNLYKALLRMVIKREVVHNNARVEDMFEVGKSRLQVMFAHLCTHPYFMQSIAKPIVDPTDDNSLVSRIIQYTIMPQQSNADKASTDAAESISFFATNYEEYKKFRKATMPHDRNQGDDEAWRGAFADQLKQYKTFLMGPETKPTTPSKIEPVKQFIDHFIKKTLLDSANSDIQQIFRFAFEEVCSSPRSTQFKVQGKDVSQGEYEPGICVPLSSLLLCGILGSILDAVSTGPFAMLKGEIKKKVVTTIKQSRGDGDGAELEEWEYDKPGRFNNVISNISTLADTLRRCVHHLRRVKQGQGTDREESDVVAACDDITEATNNALMDVLGSGKGKNRSQRFAEDSTETDLAVDLYRAHFNPRETRLTFHTEDLLMFSNLLKKYMEDPEEGRELRLEHDVKEDLVFQIVLQTLPPAKRKKGARQDGADDHDDDEASPQEWQEWSDKQINNASYIGESHNFIIRHRFLEYYKNDAASEPTFCQESLAPMPRNLCVEAQKRRRGTRVVKPFRRDGFERGPLVTIGNSKTSFCGFERLEEIISEMSSGQGNEKGKGGYKISGKDPTFSECRASLEEIQKDVSVKMEEGTFGNPAVGEKLLKNMEEGIKIIDQLKETHSTNAEGFFRYIEEAIARRGAYYTYLENMSQGKILVNKAHNEYNQKIKECCSLLTAICTKIDGCDIHDEIQASSQMYAAGSNKLGFLKAKKAKAQMPPTPAMLVLRELKKSDQDLKETDQLRAELGVPSRSFMCKELISKGVIVSLNQKLPRNVRNNMNFTFQCVDETFVVQAFMNQTLLKEFNITRKEVAQMETGRKNAVTAYGDSLVQMNCFRLRRLLAYITAEGGL